MAKDPKLKDADENTFRVLSDTVGTLDGGTLEDDAEAQLFGLVVLDGDEATRVSDGSAASRLPVKDTAVLAKLVELLAAVDGLEGFTDGLEGLLGRIPSGGAASESGLAAIAALLTTQAGYLDGVEGLLGRLPSGGVATESSLAAAKTVLDNLLAAGAGDVAGTLTDGRKTIATAGAAAAIRASLACKWVTVTALKTNTQPVYVGGSGVVADVGSEAGTPLLAGETVTIPVSNANLVFIDVLVNGEGVTFTVGS